jgi:hypothetical protein
VRGIQRIADLPSGFYRLFKPEQLVNFRDHIPPRRIVDVYPYSEFERFRQQAEVFSDVSAITLLDRSNVAIGGTLDAGPVRVALVSGNYFQMLGVTASQGRTLTPEDDRAPGGHPVALISDGFWERRLARAPNVLERKLILNGVQYSILGVTPLGFLGDWVGRPADIWIPMAMQSQVMIERPGLVGSPGDQASWLRVVARLKFGVSREQAQAVALRVRHGPSACNQGSIGTRSSCEGRRYGWIDGSDHDLS